MTDQHNAIQLDDVLITEELSRRSPRQPNLHAENEALRSLTRQLVHDPEVMLQSLVDWAVELGDADTAGVSLIETQANGEEIFRWGALAGALADQVGGCVSRHFSPCGVCLEQKAPVLFAHPERYFTALQQAHLPMPEMLVLPLVVAHQPLGTLWLVAHHEQRQFDPEDVRLMTGLADFTAATLQRHQQQTRDLQVANTALQQESTERRRAQEQALALVENLPGGAAFVVDRDLRYTMAAGKALEAANFQPEDFIGRTIFEVLPPELATRYEPLYRQALAGKPFEHEHQAHDRWYISRGTPLRAEDGEIYGVLAVSYDITDRQRVEDERQRAEQVRLQSIANLVPDLLWDSEPDGSTNWYNQRWMEYTGQTFEQAIGWGWVDAIHPDDRAGSARRYREAVERGMPLQQEHRIRRYDGEYRWFVVNASPLKDESGKVIKMYGAATDIHEQRVAREQQKEALFDSLDEGLALVEMIYDDQGEIVDMIFRQVNRAYERQGGVYNVVGRSIFDVLPGVEDYWLDLYKRVAKTGEPVRTENYQQDVDRWFDVYFSRVDDNGRFVAIVFNDISDRKQREQQQAFMLTFSDALRTEPDADAVANRALQMLIEQLQLDRSYITTYSLADNRADLDYQMGNDSVPPLPDHFVLSDFPEALKATYEGTLVIEDDWKRQGLSEAEQRNSRNLGMRAMVAATLRQDEDQPLWSMVAMSSRPRRWTPAEITLVENVAERTWAAIERAKAEAAVHKSEAKYRSLFDEIDEGFAIAEVIYDSLGQPVDILYLEANPAASRLTGVPDFTQQRMSEIAPDWESYWVELYDRVARTGVGERTERYAAPLQRWYDFSVFRLTATAASGNSRVAVIFQDITERKQREQQQAFLLTFSDALRTEPDADAIASRAVRMIAEHLRLDRCWLSEVFEQQGISTVGPEYHRSDLSPMSGVFRLSDYPETMRQLVTQPMVIPDATSDPRFADAEKALLDQLHLRALLVVALRKGQHQVIWAMAAAMTTPRHWNESERMLLEEVGEYVWAAIERARAEAALRESELQRVREQSAREQEQQRAETLAELNRAKTLFFSNVSHEFRTPLTLLLGPLEEAIKAWMSR